MSKTDKWPVEGCTLQRYRGSGQNACAEPCAGCGWHADEIAKRKRAIRRMGLAWQGGLRCLVVRRAK